MKYNATANHSQKPHYIMHPGPVNRGVELCHEVMDYERSLINQQVENGIAARMAVLYSLKPQTDLKDGDRGQK